MSEKILNKDDDEKIKDKKLLYLVRTLSRTKRKNYENFVINAIWNKLNRDDIEIVSQQYIPDPDNNEKYYMIDLYFPALKIGIECDEEQHRKTIEKDEVRELAIYNALYQYDKKGYEAKHIDITMSYDKVKKRIDEVVDEIKDKIKELEKEGLPEWILDAEKFFSDKDEITIEHKVGFKREYEVCNIIFSTDYKGMQNGCFTPWKFKNNAEKTWKKYYDGYELWFPHLAIRDKEGNLIAPAGWVNELVNDGKEIIEEKSNGVVSKKKISKESNFPKYKPKITFAKYKDPLGNDGYKFIGIFQPENEFDSEGKRHYHRKETKCKIIK